jgi:hypothetical protein
MRSADIATLYPPKALHKDLFDARTIDSWFLPEFANAMRPWTERSDAAAIDVAALPNVRLECPGVVSFDCLRPEVCAKIRAEAANYLESGLPLRAPNSMNNYGLVLNEVGMKPVFSEVLQKYMQGVAARLFGDEDHRAATLHGHPLDTDNWGGSTVASHHTFIVRYRPDQDRFLDMHVDECDVTFNFGLTPDGEFTGNDLAFCGMFGSVSHRKHLYTYQHVLGRCVVHSGKRRHGAVNITSGERSSLIMWTKSPSFRQTVEYRRKWGEQARIAKEIGNPDIVCLSETHDRDYDLWKGRAK